jgi:hypothetical protein
MSYVFRLNLESMIIIIKKLVSDLNNHVITHWMVNINLFNIMVHSVGL